MQELLHEHDQHWDIVKEEARRLEQRKIRALVQVHEKHWRRVEEEEKRRLKEVVQEHEAHWSNVKEEEEKEQPLPSVVQTQQHYVEAEGGAGVVYEAEPAVLVESESPVAVESGVEAIEV